MNYDYEVTYGYLAPPLDYIPMNVCQSCIYRVKFNRRSGCEINGVEKTIGCLDKACDKYVCIQKIT